MKVSQILPKTKVASVAPYYELQESDQTPPAGMWRWRVQGDVAILERALAVDWSSDRDALSIASDGAVTLIAALDMGSNLINNVTDPVSNQDAATKKYVDDAILTVNTFLELTDTPSSFTANRMVAVNGAGDALEWKTDAQVLALLSGDADATFDWNSQALTGIGAITTSGVSSFCSAKAVFNSWGAVFGAGYYLYLRDDDYSAYIASLNSGYLDLSGNTGIRWRVSDVGIIAGMTKDAFTLYPQIVANHGVVIGGDHLYLAETTAAITTPAKGALWLDTDDSKLHFYDTAERIIFDIRGGTISGAVVLGSTLALGGAIDMNSHQINELTDPTSAQDAATKNWVENTAIIPAANVEVSELSEATYDDVQDYINFFGDRVAMTGGGITAHGDADGSVVIAACTAWCKESNSDTAIGKFFNYAGKAKQTLTDGSANIIYLDYNGGTPQIVVATSPLTYGFQQDHILLGVVFLDGTTTHIVDADRLGIQGINRTHLQMVEHGPHRTSGMVTTSTGTRNLAITAGILHLGIIREIITSKNTSTPDTFSYWYNTDGGSTWAKTANATQISRTQYNKQTSPYGLQDLTTNRYGVHWVYMDFDDHIHVVYGQGDYTANQAEEATIPATMPNIATSFSVIIAKIICQQGTDTLTITLPWVEAFISSMATNHNLLGSLDGGTAGEYYHLTSAEHTEFQTGYILHSLAAAEDDFLVASGANTFAKQTLAETLTTLGKAAASGLASLNASTKVVEQPASITDHLDNTAGGTDAETSKAPTSNVMFDHAAVKAANATLGHVIVETGSSIDVDASGKLTLGAHASTHQNGQTDEISVTGLSGLLADDQHVLDDEVTAVAVARSIFEAHSLLVAISDNTPIVLEVAASRIIGRAASGNIVALDKAGVLGIINVADGADVTGDNPPQAHTHALAAGATDVNATAAEVNILDDATLTTAELNLLDLSAQSVIAGELLVGTGNGTAAWQKTGVILTAPTLNGTVTLGATPIFDAGSGYAQINTTGSAGTLKLQGSAANYGPALLFYHEHTTPLLDYPVGSFEMWGYDGAGSPEIMRYGMVRIVYENITDTTEAGRFQVRLANGAEADNIAFYVTGAGAGWFDAGLTVGGDIVMATHNITGLGDPSGAQDAATKNYVDTTALLIADLENPPTDIATSAATSAWSYAHNANTTTAHGAVSAATASKIVVRDAAARAKFAQAAAAGDAIVADANIRAPDSTLLEGSSKATVQDHAPKAHNQAASTITSERFPVDRLPAMTDEYYWVGTGNNVEERAVPSGATKEFFKFPDYSDGIYGKTQNYARYTMSTGKLAYWSFKVPHDFTSLTHCKILVIKHTDGTIDWTVNTDFGAVGESYLTHSDSDTADGLAMTNTEIEEIDISAAFTGIAADDYIGVEFILDAISAGTINLLGLVFKYS